MRTRLQCRTPWWISRPLLTIACALLGHDVCDDTCCAPDEHGLVRCWRCLRQVAA